MRRRDWSWFRQLLEACDETRHSHWTLVSETIRLMNGYKPRLGVTTGCKISFQGNSTEVTITQDNNATEEEKAHSEKNWQTVLQDMKELLEI